MTSPAGSRPAGPPTVAELQRWVCELVPAWRADELTGFRFLEGGYSNRNYRFTREGEAYVLRAPYRQRPFVDREEEQALLLTAELPGTPEILGFDPASGRMVSRWVAGHLLADLSPAPAEVLDYLRRLHAGLPDAPRAYDPLAQAREHLKLAAAPPWLLGLADGLRWPVAATVSCHNDLNPWNVIREPAGSWVTLDWEWFGRNDPLFDLVTLHQSLALPENLLPELAAALLGAPADQARLQECLRVFWLREYAWAAAELAGGETRVEIAEQRSLGEARLAALL